PHRGEPALLRFQATCLMVERTGSSRRLEPPPPSRRTAPIPPVENRIDTAWHFSFGAALANATETITPPPAVNESSYCCRLCVGARTEWGSPGGFGAPLG